MPAAAFSGQTAVVTGATGGVGKAIAGRLIAAGAEAVLVGRTQRSVEQVMVAEGWNPAQVSGFSADLANESEVQRVAREVSDRCQQVHILVHAAGIIVPGTIQNSRLEDFDNQYVVNVRSPYQLTQSLLPRMVTCGGQVVFINSSAGINARADVSQYAATKHALRAVADGLRDEVNQLGVRVTSLFLGRTASRMQAAVHEHEHRPYKPERLLQPDDVAGIVLQLLQLPRTAEVTDLHMRPMLKS